MKTLLLTPILFLFAFAGPEGKKPAKVILGKWKSEKLEHYTASDELDAEATAHFSEMSVGRTMNFSTDGTVAIPRYEGCTWRIENSNLFIQYGTNGQTTEFEILEITPSKMVLKNDMSEVQEGDYHVETWVKVEE